MASENGTLPVPADERSVSVAVHAEQVVLGAMMCGSAELASQHLTHDDFVDYRHAQIYDHILELWGAGAPTGPAAVHDRIDQHGELRKDTALYLAHLYEHACGHEHIAHYAGIITQGANRRRVAALGAKLSNLAERALDPDAARIRLTAIVAELGAIAHDTTRNDGINERIPSVDWETAYTIDFTQIDWLPGNFMERGQQVALVGDGKVGKSLFALDWAISMAAGRPFLDSPAMLPVRVLYLDRENSLRDIITRARAFGAKPADLGDLIYKQFPALTGGLDAESRRAANEVLALVKYHRADVVVIDTVSRFIDGKENDSDTWLQLYQALHAELKAAGVASLRLDHFGKDDTRGSRGSSAKAQDVDHVWELSKANERSNIIGNIEVITSRLKLARTHTRTGLGSDGYVIDRRGERRVAGMWVDGQTSHTVSSIGVIAAVRDEIDDVVDELLVRGVPNPERIGRDTLKKWMADQEMATSRTKTLSGVVRRLHERAALMSENTCSQDPLM